MYATSQLSQGRNIKAMQKALGHASAATMDTYWPVLPDEEELLRGSAAGLVRDVCGMAPAASEQAERDGEGEPPL